jgi:uncharacterized protein
VYRLVLIFNWGGNGVHKNENMLLGLLQIVEANDGRMDSRIILQKQAFLLSYFGYSQIASSSFAYHHFGPFSRELSEYLQFATSSGLLSEAIAPGMNDGVKYSYSLTEQGRQFLSEAGSLNEKFVELVTKFKAQHWRTLELVATTLFLQSREKVDQLTAFDHALKLKPDTKSYVETARKFLDESVGR